MQHVNQFNQYFNINTPRTELNANEITENDVDQIVDDQEEEDEDEDEMDDNLSPDHSFIESEAEQELN